MAWITTIDEVKLQTHSQDEVPKLLCLLLKADFSVPAASWIWAPSRIALIKYKVLFAVPFLNEPLTDLIADDEEIPLDMRCGVIFWEAQVDCAADVDGNLIKALIDQGIAGGREPMKVPLLPGPAVAYREMGSKAALGSVAALRLVLICSRLLLTNSCS